MSHLPPGSLMQRAGAAAAREVRDICRRAGRRVDVLLLAGSGNNGGDALEAAAVLRRGGMRVRVLLHGDPARQPRDAAAAHARALAAGVEIHPFSDWQAQLERPCNLVVDGLFGIGLQRPLTGEIAEAVQTINEIGAARLPVLALDVPSGIDADTGTVVGGAVAVRASHTITFIGDKPGLHTADGCDHAGEVRVAGLDIASGLPPPDGMLNHPGLFAACLRPRARNTHKGSFGDVVLLGGASGMAGAVVLAARAALHAGAGRTYAAFIGPVPVYDDAHPELMCRAAHEIDLARKVVVAGPGMGSGEAARAALTAALKSPMPAVFDADALNLLASDRSLMQALADRGNLQQPSLLTPHPLEAARLLGMKVAEVQSDRLAAARALAESANAVVILKGAGSIIAAPDRPFVINPTGNPALATGGTGDVLAGLCGALLAQGWPAHEAALGAAWMHGHAADELVRKGVGPIGLTASELIPALRLCLNQLVAERSVRP
ncbi:NAD(P)H-hydrate dehydratase [Noviherbaspirillum humi]|nr:NAD(P)H-hydrate dehydratase [Noviherbaspirillum humi]